MVKKIFLLKNYIAIQVLVQSMLLTFVGSFFNTNAWKYFFDNFFSSIFNMVFCFIIVGICYICIDNNLEYEVEVDNYPYLIKCNYLVFDSAFFGSIVLIVIYIISYFSNNFFGKYIDPKELILWYGIISAPVFFIKLAMNIIMFFARMLLGIVITTSTVDDMVNKEKQGKLTVMEAFLRIEALKVINESLKTDVGSIIANIDTSPFTEKIQKKIYTNGRTQEAINQIEYQNEASSKRASVVAVLLLIFFVGNSISFSVNSMRQMSRYNDDSKKIEILDNHKKDSDFTHISSSKYIIHNNNGAKKLLDKGSLALVADNVPIKMYESTFRNYSEPTISNQSVESRIVKIKNVRTLDYGGEARLSKDMTFYESAAWGNKKNNVKQEYHFPQGTRLMVDQQFADEFYCHIIKNNESYGVLLYRDAFIPVKPHYWYYVSINIGNMQDTGWIEGKYLTEVTVNPKYVENN